MNMSRVPPMDMRAQVLAILVGSGCREEDWHKHTQRVSLRKAGEKKHVRTSIHWPFPVEWISDSLPSIHNTQG